MVPRLTIGHLPNGSREQIVLERHGEVRAPTLLAVTSLDEAIDILDSKAARPLLALYIFAQPKSAKYLGQFIRAEVEFINHIPMNILGASYFRKFPRICTILTLSSGPSGSIRLSSDTNITISAGDVRDLQPAIHPSRAWDHSRPRT